MELKEIYNLYGHEIHQAYLLLGKHWKKEIKSKIQLDQFFKQVAKQVGFKDDYKIFAYAVLSYSKSIETIAVYPNFEQNFKRGVI